MNSTQHKMVKNLEAWDSDSDGAGNRLQRKEKARKRPRGGRKSIYMDAEEVKACKELGFELEDDDDDDHDHDGGKKEHHMEKKYHHDHMPLERITTNRSSLSRQYSSTFNSTSDNSSIQNWRISNPGDDPRDVKARLKVWAQAVALESTSQLQH